MISVSLSLIESNEFESIPSSSLDFFILLSALCVKIPFSIFFASSDIYVNLLITLRINKNTKIEINIIEIAPIKNITIPKSLLFAYISLSTILTIKSQGEDDNLLKIDILFCEPVSSPEI